MTALRFFLCFSFFLCTNFSLYSNPPTCQYCEHGKGYLYSRHASSTAPYIGAAAVLVAAVVIVIALTHHHKKGGTDPVHKNLPH